MAIGKAPNATAQALIHRRVISLRRSDVSIPRRARCVRKPQNHVLQRRKAGFFDGLNGSVARACLFALPCGHLKVSTMSDNAQEVPDTLLTRQDAAKYLTRRGLVMAAQTLARKFHEGTGPLCTHVGERAMYWRSHLDSFFDGQISAPRRSSSEPRRSQASPLE